MRTPNEVERQYAALVAEIPSLLRHHQGRWAVYLDSFRGSFATQWEALDWASANLGEVPFCIAQVEPPRTVLLTAALAFAGGPS
jgi:hypothetical protein